MIKKFRIVVNFYLYVKLGYSSPLESEGGHSQILVQVEFATLPRIRPTFRNQAVPESRKGEVATFVPASDNFLQKRLFFVKIFYKSSDKNNSNNYICFLFTCKCLLTASGCACPFTVSKTDMIPWFL